MVQFLLRCMKCRRGLAMIILSVRPSVRPSVCPSVKHVNCDKIYEKSVQVYKRSFSLVFSETNGWWGATPSTWIFGSTDPRWGKIAEFEQIIARSASAVTPSEKSSINTNRKYTAHFPMCLRWSSYVAPKSPKGLKNAKRPFFPLKSHFPWRKSATKVLCVKTVSGKVAGHSLA